MMVADDRMQVHSLSKRYGRRTVVDSVSFAVRAGSVTGLLGPNGAGKSTCLHMLTGAVPPDDGTISIGGIAASDPQAKLLLGFAPDDLPLPEALTGREYLAFHDRVRRRSDLDVGLQIMEALDVLSAVDQQILEYSHGMKRKVQLAAALMHSPELLILDEPFRGLDPDAMAVVAHLIVTMAQHGKSVLMATHDLARAEVMCDAVVIIDRGAVAGQGAPARLTELHGRNESLEAAFLAMTGREADADRKKRLIADTLERTAE